MPGGFNIRIAADASVFTRAVKSGVIDPLEDASNALDDLNDVNTRGLQNDLRDVDKQLDKVGKSGKDAGDDLEKGLKDAQRQTNLTADDYRQMTAKIEAETRKLKSSGKESFTPAQESSRAFKEEATSNLSEVASSFDGSAQSITDLFQGTLGGIITELGPLGMAAGTAAAVGIGLIGAAFNQSGEDSDAFKERVESMTGELLDDFYEVGDAVTVIDKKLRDWASDNEKYGVSLVQLRKDAKAAEVGFGDLASTIAGGTTKDLRKMRGEIDSSIDALSKQAAAVDTTAGADRSASRAASDKVSRLKKDVIPAINQQIKANENAKAAEEALADAQGMTVKQYRNYVKEQNAAKEAAEALADTMTNVLAAAAESTSEAIDNAAEDPSKYIAGMEARTKAAQQYQANVQAIGEQLPDDLMNFVRNQGEGFSQEIATYLSATPEQQARIREGWKIDAQVSGDTTDLDKKTAAKGKEKKKGPTSEVKGDTKDLDDKVEKKSRQKSDGPTAKLRADTDAVDKAIDSLKRKTFNGPTAVFRVDRSSVNQAITNIRNTTITVKVKAVDG